MTGIVLLLNFVAYGLEDLACFFTVAGGALYGQIRSRLSSFAASLSLSLFRFRLVWPWRFACVERFGGLSWTGGIDCGGTPPSLVMMGKASSRGDDIGEAGGVERGKDAVDGGRERSGEVRGEELNKYLRETLVKLDAAGQIGFMEFYISFNFQYFAKPFNSFFLSIKCIIFCKRNKNRGEIYAINILCTKVAVPFRWRAP